MRLKVISTWETNATKKLLTFPYSLVDETLIVGPGNFPVLRTGMKGTPRFMETRGPNRNPLASRPAKHKMKTSYFVLKDVYKIVLVLEV